MENIAVKGNEKLLKALAEQWKENGFEQVGGKINNGPDNFLHMEGSNWYWGYSNHTKNKVYTLPEDWEYLASLTPEREFKEGHYVIRNNGRGRLDFLRLDKKSDSGFYMQSIQDDKPNSDPDSLAWIKENFRKATKDEIKQALIKEAKRRGLKPGEFVITSSGKFKYKLDKLNYNYKYYLSKDHLYCAAVLIYDNGTWAEKVDDTPDIKINGYEADFHDDYVQFGCAKIVKEIFVELSKLLHTEIDARRETKHINKITIGKGEFTTKQIHSIAEYYKSRD